MLAMERLGNGQEPPRHPRALSSAPAELTCQRLQRIGEGVGKVVYASEHWVVRRERSSSEIIALIVIWKLARRIAHFIPGGDKLFERPSHRNRLFRVMMQSLILLVPRGLWYTTHIGEVWRIYRFRSERGESLAQTCLHGTALVPEEVIFPPTRVQVGGWPGWLEVSQATQRVEDTLYARLVELAEEGRFEEVEEWLNRFLELRQAGWSRGVFSMDAHLKNFGVCGDRVVLIDTGGLTDSWSEIQTRLGTEQNDVDPHIRLGMGSLLASRPDIAERFNSRWRAVVSSEGVRQHWPE
ncbi:MAG: hypothetical protein ABFD86_07750 [Bryobacteraceae bacterium]